MFFNLGRWRPCHTIETGTEKFRNCYRKIRLVLVYNSEWLRRRKGSSVRERKCSQRAIHPNPKSNPNPISFQYLERMCNVSKTDRRDSLPNRKRKLLHLTPADSTPRGLLKRRSSVSDVGLLSGSLLDYTASPTVKNDIKELDVSTEPKKKTMRYNHFMDLFGTESNYVDILNTITTVSTFHVIHNAIDFLGLPTSVNKDLTRLRLPHFICEPVKTTLWSP